MKTKKTTGDEWVEQLKARFPALFRGISRWGFGCDAGWSGLITRLCERLDALGLPELKIVQVKEKFGTLRFYVEGRNDAAAALIQQAKVESAETCEWCAAKGELRKSEHGYFLTLCGHCFDKWASNDWVMAPPSASATSLDYSFLGTPEFQAGLAKLAEDYPNVVKRHFDQLRSNAPNKTIK